MAQKNWLFLLALCVLLGIASKVDAQKHDYTWVFGYQAMHGSPFGFTLMHFGEDTVTLESRPDATANMGGQNMSMSDGEGNLIFYSNGYVIFNAVHDTMVNGKGINPLDFQADPNLSPELGYGSPQCLISLPDPGDSMRYYVLQGDVRLFMKNQIQYSCVRRLLVHIVDMRGDNGRGAIVQKAKPLLLDSLFAFTVCKHANGRDWWLLLHRKASSHFWMYRLSPQGFAIEFESELPFFDPFTLANSYEGYGLFSPDGSTYLLHTFYKLRIWDFDRCTGTFSNPREFDTGTIGTQHAVYDTELSKDNQYLYLSYLDYVLQCNLNHGDSMVAWADTVAHRLKDSIYSQFFLWQLAPNGKLYGSATSSNNRLHVIQHPDSAGRACKLEPPGLELAGYNAFGLPHFPNYRLGPLAGSACDTLTHVEPVPSTGSWSGVWVYPNPVPSAGSGSGLVTLGGLPPGRYQVILTDLLGRRLMVQQISSQRAAFEVTGLPSGTYTWRVSGADGRVWQGLLVIQSH